MGEGVFAVPENILGEGTVVQVEVLDKKGETPYLGYERGYSFHGQVLSDLLRRLGIGFDTKLSKGGICIPLSKGEGYELVGAGRCGEYGEELHFYGDSTDYKMGINFPHLRILLPVFRKRGLKVFFNKSFGGEPQELTEEQEA